MLSVDRSTKPRQMLVRTQSSLYDSGRVSDTREPSGKEGPDVPAVLRAAVMAKNGETRRKLNLDSATKRRKLDVRAQPGIRGRAGYAVPTLLGR